VTNHKWEKTLTCCRCPHATRFHQKLPDKIISWFDVLGTCLFMLTAWLLK